MGSLYNKEEEALACCEPVYNVPALTTEDLFADLCDRGVEILASVTFEKFVGVDGAAELPVELTVGDDIHEEHGNSNSEPDGDEASRAGAVWYF